MAVKQLIKKYARTYQHTSPELKIPLALFLYLLLLINKGIDLSASLKRKPVHIKKTLMRKPLLYRTPLRSKLKYFAFGSIFSLCFAFLPAITIIFLQDLPNPRELTLRSIPQTTKIYDRNRTLLYEIYSQQNRTMVELRDIPLTLQHATLAIEDKNFYKHPGFDLPSIIRALRENLSEGSTIQGGSTITQQLIKSSLLTSEKKFSRKIKELVLAFWSERMYTKNQILEMYFNQVPYGGTAWGVEAASEVYFGKQVKQLDLAESAFLAGITQAPSLYSPYGTNPTLWKKRQAEVLSRMVALNYINKKQATTAAKEHIQFKKPQTPLKAPHFVMYIKDLLIREHGIAAVEKGGLTVVTSLDLKTQDMAQKIVAEEVNNDGYLNLSNGAALVTNPQNGDILAMVGSRDFNDETIGKVNVTTALRQPGSTVKVITYSAALTKGFTAASMLDDSPITFPGGEGAPPYSPVNYDGHYYGRVPLRFALSNSLNIAAVKTLNTIGVSTMVSLARRMGISHWDGNINDYGLSVTLGGKEATMLDMATVFGTLSNQGKRTDLNPILSVTDDKGTILDEKQQTDSIRVLPEGIAYIISNILADNDTRTAAFGPNSVLAIPGHTVSVKTGTSDNKRDNWTIGYTKDRVVTVWVGNNDGAPMNPALASGITGAAPIWHKVMANLVGNKPDNFYQPPTDVVFKPCFGRTEYFLRGTENTFCTNTFPTPKVFSAN